MTLRQKILLMFSLTIVLTVAAVAWTVSARVRQMFDDAERERTSALVAQFLKEYQRRGEEVAQKMERLARDERIQRMGYDLSHGGEPATYVTEASSLGQEYGLDFLEITMDDGTIVSSAQWPARFGYRDAAVITAGGAPFLKRETLANDRTELGLFATKVLSDPAAALTLLGGERLDSAFVSNLSAPAGTAVYLYRNTSAQFEAGNLLSSSGTADGERFGAVIEKARSTGAQATTELGRRNAEEPSLGLAAVPLKLPDGSVGAVLVIANSREALLQTQQHIRAVAYGIAAIGILFAVLVSLWIAASVSRPIEQLAEGAREIAEGRWEVEVPVRSSGEIAELGRGFNHMARELVHQRERLVQSERVAAWRELARRLAHELKNPLFPLQLTVENMVRARTSSPEMFDEVFAEGVTALSQEIANLKTIIGRFSDFSKMPKPERSPMDLRDVVTRVLRLYQPVLAEHTPPIRTVAKLPETPMMMLGDSELLHRALSNLVLNAMDAMPEGGALTIAATQSGNALRLTVSDTGQGMTAEECGRLFTPYYTTREHGTGLGLAIVQSVIADHDGTIAVESTPGRGTTFLIELPAAPPGDRR